MGLVLIAVLLFLGCTAGDHVAGPAPEQHQTDSLDDTTGLTFADERLQAAVRLALHVPAGPLATAAAETLTQLDATGRGIESLEGIQRLASLHILLLGQNKLIEISPLATLTGLTRLDLSENRLTDLGALSALVQLQDLQLTANRVGDLQPLSDLTHLHSLLVAGNPIHDLSPLLLLAQLRTLEVSDSSMTDPATAAQVTALRSRGVMVVVKTTVADTVLPDTSWQGRLGAVIGTRLAFVSDMEDGQQDVYLLDARGRLSRLTRDGRLGSRLSWSADGRYLRLVAPDGRLAIHDVMTGLQTESAAPTSPQRSMVPSPDGSRLAYTLYRDDRLELYVSALGEAEGEQLTHERLAIIDPAWSPDGATLYYAVAQYYVGTYTADHVGIYEVSAVGGVPRRLTPLVPVLYEWVPAVAYYELAVSPDGTQLAYRQRVNPSPARDQIGVLDLAKGTILLATEALLLANPKTTRYISSPCWSPDGTSLLFVLEGTLWSQLWLVPADGSGPGYRLDPGPEYWPPGHFGSLAWAPRVP